MTTLVIESNIPIPPRRKGYVATLRLMQVGDSVFLPVDIDSATKLAHQVFGTGGYTTRKGMGGTRIWRIAQRENG